MMANWKTKRIREAQKKYKFDCEKFIKLSDKERQNLAQLRGFNKFDWFIEAVKLSQGSCFGELAFEDDLPRE